MPLYPALRYSLYTIRDIGLKPRTLEPGGWFLSELIELIDIVPLYAKDMHALATKDR